MPTDDSVTIDENEPATLQQVADKSLINMEQTKDPEVIQNKGNTDNHEPKFPY
jgi:hypothetical protein